MREAAAAKADKLGCAPYEALLDEYEPGMRVAEIDRLFAGLDLLPAGAARSGARAQAGSRRRSGQQDRFRLPISRSSAGS